MDDITLNHYREIHIVGIGGAGMSAIARVLHARGFHVHGSDRRDSPLAEALRAEGIPVAVGHAPENVGAADLVLTSAAVPEDNAELQAAQARAIPVMPRPDFLGRLTQGTRLIAVAGAHGKTTTTGMLALLLLEAGMDPSFIVGGVLADLSTNARAGQSDVFLIEADEYRDTFLALQPTIAVVTNVEYDHPDYFRSPRFLRHSFGNFVDNIRPGGLLVACNDDPLAHAVAASYHSTGKRLVLYGRQPGADVVWRASNIRPNELGGVTFTAEREDGVAVDEIALRIPGAYNAVNALAVLCVASELKIEWEITCRALERFTGTARRFEVLGESGGITVIDDYAHHPTQIRAVLDAASGRYPERRIVAVWEPHTFSRVRALFADFMTAFRGADQVIVLPIYAARENDDGQLSHLDLVKQMNHSAVTAVTRMEEAAVQIVAQLRPGDVVMMMGAGNEYVVGQQVLAQLRA